MRKDIIAFGIAIPVVAVIVLGLNKGKAVSVPPKKQAAGAAVNATDMKSMENVCKSLVGKDKSKLAGTIGQPYTTAAGISYYQAAQAGFKPPYAIAVTFNKKKKVSTAKVVTYGQ